MSHLLKIAVVGAGSMGRHHSKAIKRLDAQANLVAIVDAELTLAQDLATELNVPETFRETHEMLAKVHPDVVHVCTSPASHATITRMVIENGAHSYVEKPFVETTIDAEDLLDLAAKSGLKVCAGHQLLFERPMFLVAPLMRGLGKIQHVESYFAFRQARRSDGRMPFTASEQLLDILPHPVYLMLHFMQPHIARDAIQVDGLRVDERGDANLLVSSGSITGCVTVTLRGRPIDSFVRVIGTRGTVFLDFVRGIVIPSFGVGSTIDKVLDPYQRALTIAIGSTASLARRFLKRQRSYPGLAEAFSTFYTHIADGGPPPVTTENILHTVALCENVASELTKAKQTSVMITPEKPPTVAVTGGTGWLGKEVVRQLLEDGETPLAISRRPPLGPEQLRGAHYLAADLSSKEQVVLPKSVKSVIHCAAETAGGWDAHQRNSIDATARIVEIMKHAGIPRLVHVSSLAVVDSKARQPLDEQSMIERKPRQRGPYVWGKLGSEQIVLEAVQSGAIDARIVRPGALVDRENFEPPGKLGRRIGRWFVAVGGRSATIPVCGLNWGAQVIVWVTAHFEEAAPILHAIDPEPASRKSLARDLKTVSPELRIVWIPRPMLAIMSGLATVAQWILRPGRPAISLRSAFEAPRCSTELVKKIQHM